MTNSQECVTERSGAVNTSQLHLEWAEAYWDSAVFSFPVLQINLMQIRGPLACEDFLSFEATRDKLGARLVSCRLSHQCLSEAFLLEEHGFRFVEMVFHPELDGLQTRKFCQPANLKITLADNENLDPLLGIAGKVFRNDRFHVDPRLDSALSDRRYCNWVRDSLKHPTQKVYAFSEGDRLVAFFVTELLEDGTCYWHLTAVAHDLQNQGYGRRVWVTMLKMLKESGVNHVRTCISARNHRVLNLYASLGFCFPPPMMTFHWFRDV